MGILQYSTSGVKEKATLFRGGVIERFESASVVIHYADLEEFANKFNALGATAKMPISVKPCSPEYTTTKMAVRVHYYVQV